MLDKFHRIAVAVQLLLIPLILVGCSCLVYIAVILMSAGSDESERYLTPSLLGFVWSATAYSFIATFRKIPEKTAESHRLAGKIVHRIRRGWYLLIALVFLGTTIAALVLTGRLISVWQEVG